PPRRSLRRVRRDEVGVALAPSSSSCQSSSQFEHVFFVSLMNHQSVFFFEGLLFSDLAASCPHSISSERTLFGWLDSFNSSQPDTFLATKQERNSCRMLSGCSLVRYAGRSITSDTLLIDDRVGVPYCISK